jgi:hypothetical protein
MDGTFGIINSHFCFQFPQITPPLNHSYIHKSPFEAISNRNLLSAEQTAMRAGRYVPFTVPLVVLSIIASKYDLYVTTEEGHNKERIADRGIYVGLYVDNKIKEEKMGEVRSAHVRGEI